MTPLDPIRPVPREVPAVGPLQRQGGADERRRRRERERSGEQERPPQRPPDVDEEGHVDVRV